VSRQAVLPCARRAHPRPRRTGPVDPGRSCV